MAARPFPHVRAWMPSASSGFPHTPPAAGLLQHGLPAVQVAMPNFSLVIVVQLVSSSTSSALAAGIVHVLPQSSPALDKKHAWSRWCGSYACVVVAPMSPCSRMALPRYLRRQVSPRRVSSDSVRSSANGPLAKVCAASAVRPGPCPVSRTTPLLQELLRASLMARASGSAAAAAA